MVWLSYLVALKLGKEGVDNPLIPDININTI
jgi:hypothetical protein